MTFDVAQHNLSAGMKMLLKKREEIDTYNIQFGWDSNMSNYCGKIVTISSVQHSLIRIEEDGGNWMWSCEAVASIIGFGKPLKLEELI